jgi:hypothetical protein
MTAKKYFLDFLPISVARILPALSVLLAIHNMLAIYKPFDWGIFDPLAPFLQIQIATGNESWIYNLLINLVPALLLWFLWVFAEDKLDQERHAHQTAFEETVPTLKNRIAELEAELKTKKSELTTQKSAQSTLAGKYSTLTGQHTTTTAQAEQYKSQAEQYKGQAQQAQKLLTEAQNELKESQALQSKYKEQALQARAQAATELSGELRTFINGATDYYNRLQRHVKNAPVEVAAPTQTPALQAARAVTDEPKENYF